MDLKLPIEIHDELSDALIVSTGLLDLASGEIRSIEYRDYDVRGRGLPMEQEDYEFTCGLLSHAGKEVEFRVDVDVTTGRYSVSPSELLEIKVRAAKLFAGIEGASLLGGGAAAAPAAARPAAAAKTGGRRR